MISVVHVFILNCWYSYDSCHIFLPAIIFNFQEILLVLDGTTGLNMLPQAREFNEVSVLVSIFLNYCRGLNDEESCSYVQDHLYECFYLRFANILMLADY